MFDNLFSYLFSQCIFPIQTSLGKIHYHLEPHCNVIEALTSKHFQFFFCRKTSNTHF